MSKVGTEDLPGSDFSLDFAKRKEVEEVDKENDFKNANEFEQEVDEDDNNGGHNDDDEDGSSQDTRY